MCKARSVGGLGPCSICGRDIALGAAFVNVGPTDWNDPDRPKSERYVPVDEDIHGWSPFVTIHPACFAQDRGLDHLLSLVDESHRRMRHRPPD